MASPITTATFDENASRELEAEVCRICGAWLTVKSNNKVLKKEKGNKKIATCLDILFK
jgi:hypothetical protein